MNYANQEQNVKTEERVIEKAITGNVTVKKKTVMSTVGSWMKKAVVYTYKEVLIPAAKRMGSEAGKIFIDSLIYGDSAPARDNRMPGNTVSYRSYWDRPANSRPAEQYPRNAFDVSNVQFDTESDAMRILQRMREICTSYKKARVHDFYDLCGLAAPYTAYGYGWTSLTYARVVRTFNGKYYIEFPEPMPID